MTASLSLTTSWLIGINLDIQIAYYHQCRLTLILVLLFLVLMVILTNIV